MGQPALTLRSLLPAPSRPQFDCAGTMIVIDKPAGMTSFDVVARIRRATGEQRVGHAGTLDPFATGVLIVGLGRGATRRLGEITGAEKEYLARVRLGIATDTYDITGRITSQSGGSNPSESQIEMAMQQFRGEISQIPPPYSAVKVNGKRAYHYARKGTAIVLDARTIRIRLLDLLETTQDGFRMKVICSSGTYIRSLANDIGAALGVGGSLAELRRTRIGEYTLEAALELDDFIRPFTMAAIPG